ncbi:uncharacterized protein LOC113233931 [Hyposmocoma kahamanoa]|uniref:uncharacterized protein LOC113233931 n=1 Tax=Hyposmocoma kahamanoa TaxID=1477025 RepID=UPI000E6D7AAD|nr:uncharacterized protein LOC113233931 [Hyposmocoma kahamanoa]
MEDYIDSMDLKNRTKYTANLQYDQLDLIRIKKFIHDSNHDVEQGQGDNLKNDEQEFSFKNIIDSNFLDEIDSSIKHSTDKINVIDYDSNNVNDWNYNDQQHASKPKLAEQNEPIDNTKSEYIFNLEARKPGIFVIEHVKNRETYTNTPEYRFNQQTHSKHKTYKHELEDINKLEYIYFDKSESEEEIEDNDKNKHKHTDKVDYIQVPMYEMEKTPSKEKTNVEGKQTKFRVKQGKSDQYSNLQKTRTTLTHMIPKKEKILQGRYNDTRTINVTKSENVTLKWTNMTDVVAEKDLNSTWDHHQLPHPQFNLPPYYSPVKLMASEDPFIPKPPVLAKIFHSGTPRFDLFFQKVDNKISFSSEYIYSIIFISAVTSVILFIACMIAWFFYCNQNAMQRSIEKYQYQVILIAVFALCIISSIVAIIGLSLIHTGLERMRTKTLNPTVKHLNYIIDKLHYLREQLQPVDGHIAALRGAISFLEKFGLSLQYVSNILSQIENGKSRFIALVYDVESKFTIMKQKAQIGLSTADGIITAIGVISWLIILVFIVGLLVMEQFREQMEDDEVLHQVRVIVGKVALGMIAFCCLLAILTEVVMIAVSDFCSDPVESVIRHNPYKSAELSDDTIKNFMTCNYKYAAIDIAGNPQVATMKNTIESAIDTFKKLNIPGNYMTDLNSIEEAIKEAFKLADFAKKCGDTKEIFQAATESICQYGLNGLFYHFMGSILVAITIDAVLIISCAFEFM